MSKKQKAKEFWGKHKKKIILGGVLAAVGITAVVVSGSKKKCKDDQTKLLADNWEREYEKRDSRIAALDWQVGKMDDLWEDDFGYNAIINDINVSDIGLLGDEFTKFEGVSPDSNVTMMIGVEPKL
jgi:hypothetical protein